MELSGPQYWSVESFPSPGGLPNPGVKPRSPTLQVDSSPAEPQRKPPCKKGGPRLKENTATWRQRQRPGGCCRKPRNTWSPQNPEGAGRTLPWTLGGAQLCWRLDFRLLASTSRGSTFYMPAIGRSVTAAAGASPSRQESLDSGRQVASQGPRAQEQPGWKLPALALLLLLADPPPQPPAPTPASRTLPTSTHRPADYEERSVNAPTSAVAKLVSLQERSPDKNTQALGALGRASAHPGAACSIP